MIYALPNQLDEWAPGKFRSRWDFQTNDHTLQDIVDTGDTYFARCFLNLRAGDLVTLYTADHRRATIIIDHIDAATHKVAFSIEREHDDQPIVPKAELFAYRWRGPRGGGHSIVDAAGVVLQSGFPSKDDALRHIANLMDKAA